MIRSFDIVRLSDGLIDEMLSSIKGFRDEKKERERLLRAVGIVIESDGHSCCVDWFDKESNLRNAWWDEKDFVIVNNIVCMIGNAMSHPFGPNTKQGDRFYRCAD